MCQRTVLIIDDDRATRDALQQHFIGRGWEVAMVATQAEALLLLADYDPEWVVIPWEQLEGTGERFMRHVRGMASKPRVVLLTEPEDPSSRGVANRLKPDAHFRKPLVPEHVYLTCSSGAGRNAVPVG